MQISEVACGQANGRQDKRAAVLGLRPLRQWKIYQFTSVPGVYNYIHIIVSVQCDTTLMLMVKAVQILQSVASSAMMTASS